MTPPSVTWNTEQLPKGIVRLSFAGTGRMGSYGNPDGARMQEAIKEVLAKYSPKSLIIDLCSFEYRFGNWIGSALLMAWLALGRGHVCILATGETASALRSLWESSKLDQIIPLVQDADEALERLSYVKG